MTQPIQNIDNAREEEQRQIMEELAQTGECFLCEKTIDRITAKYPGIATLPIHRGDHWFVKHNDFPYGTRVHLIIAPFRHVMRIEDLEPAEFAELQKMVIWVNDQFGLPGGSLFVRYGDMSYTGATLSHLHFHILSGVAERKGETQPVRAKLAFK